MIAPEDQPAFIDAVVETAFAVTVSASSATPDNRQQASASSSGGGGVGGRGGGGGGKGGQGEASVIAKCVHRDGVETLSLVKFRCVFVGVVDR